MQSVSYNHAILYLNTLLAHQDLILGQADLSTTEGHVQAAMASLQLSRSLRSAVHSPSHVQLLSASGSLANFHSASRDGSWRSRKVRYVRSSVAVVTVEPIRRKS